MIVGRTFIWVLLFTIFCSSVFSYSDHLLVEGETIDVDGSNLTVITIGRDGVYVEGPIIVGAGSDVGPNCYLRAYTCLGRNVRVGAGCEIKKRGQKIRTSGIDC